MKRILAVFLIIFVCRGMGNDLSPQSRLAGSKEIVINENNKAPYISESLFVDKVWSSHPVGFFLMTDSPRQYVAYYDADRRMVVAMRNLDSSQWIKFYPQTQSQSPPVSNQATTKLGWDGHNYVTMAIDKKGFVHLSGNMHGHYLTYFRSTQPYDITTLEQVEKMTGEAENQCTYPKFMTNPNGDTIFTYRDGGSGCGSQIYNIYNTDNKTWSRLFDTLFVDGKGDRSAYLNGPTLGGDDWYHLSWIWRDTGDCSTNHDLCYAKSPDLVNWYTVRGEKLQLPILFETCGVSVDPIPVQGGIINGSGKVGFDNRGRVVLAYHKFDQDGNTQIYCARFTTDKWEIKQLTDWDYRWYFRGNGSLKNMDIRIGEVTQRSDNYMELYSSHAKYGKFQWLLNDNLEIVGKINKPRREPSSLNKVQSEFPEMLVRRATDTALDAADGSFYFLQWETLPPNGDLPREGALPEPSDLILYKINYNTQNVSGVN